MTSPPQPPSAPTPPPSLPPPSTPNSWTATSPASPPPSNSRKPSPVLRAQLDRSPDDPRLYERLAQFLTQNNLSADEEQTYRLALDRFKDPSWYNRLAGLYLRQKRAREFAALTRQVTDIFSGTELDRWFAQVQPSAPALGPQLALQLNLYAAKRFPHDLVFTRNLLARLLHQAHRKPRRLRHPPPRPLVRVPRPPRPLLRVPQPHQQTRSRTSPTSDRLTAAGCPIHSGLIGMGGIHHRQPRRHPRARRSPHLVLPLRSNPPP